MKNPSIQAAELFLPKPWKHDIKKCKKPSHGAFGYCEKCGELFGKGYKNEGSFGCPVTDLGKALECFRGLLDPNGLDCGLEDEMREGYNRATGRHLIGRPHREVEVWFRNKATAEQIWGICCLAKEYEE